MISATKTDSSEPRSDGSELHACAACEQPASSPCLSCKHHRPTNQQQASDDCRAFEIRENDLYGRYVVASRDLAPGDLILRERAFAYGPKQNSTPVCLGCTTLLEEEQHRCSRCQFPLCSPECEESETHRVECSVLAMGGAKARPEVEDFSKPAPYLDVVTTLRMLRLKTEDRTAWERIMQMDSSPLHWPNSPVAAAYQHNVINFLKTVCKLDVDDQLLLKIGGILMTNAFEARGRGGSHVRCVMPAAALLAHSCLPNVHHTIDEHFVIYLRAAQQINKGETLFTSYTHCLSGTAARREIVRCSKFFDCGCDRCADPTELGTYFSALKCCRCSKGGLILPKKSLDADSEWQCSECGYEVHPDNVRKLCRVLLAELDSLEASDFIDYEMFLRKYANLLHPNHYLIFDAKHRLSQMYGRSAGYCIQHLTELHLRRKIELCRDVLAITIRNAPGIARITGLTYYEVHAPLMVLAQRLYNKNAISRTEMKALLDEADDSLHKAIEILKYEPANSLEGKIHTAALLNVTELAALRQLADDMPESGRGLLAPDHLDQLVGSFNAILELMEDYQWRS